ncbi:MAG: hypothetical protein RLP15_03755 [Cryomorphaceae bacterium]
MNPSSYYQAQIETESEKYSTLKRHDRFYSIGRGVLMLGAAALFYGFYADGIKELGIIGFFALLGFGVVFRHHQTLRSKLTHTVRKLEVLEVELRYTNEDYSSLDEGMRFRDEEHPYSSDLDIYGKKSLFQRLNRAKSQGAKQLLADELNQLSWKEVAEQQHCIEQLAKDPLRMIEFRTILAGLEETDVLAKVIRWTQSPSVIPIFFWKPLIWVFTLAFPLAFAWIIWTNNMALLDVLIYPFLLNLLVLGAGMKAIKKEHAWVDQIHKDVAVKSKLIEHFLSWDTQDTLLDREKKKLTELDSDASEELRKMGRIIGQLDGMSNLVAAVVLNGTLLYHVHVYWQLVRWKTQYGPSIVRWLEAVESVEVWVSKGQFKFNHPSYAFPTMVGNNKFEAEGLGHPFLTDDKRVANDVDFEGYKMMVLTGSNMAGKSTFLRAIGVNMILASVGLPVCATRLSLSPFQLLSSMKPQDSVNDDRSYFLAEVLR